MKKGKPYEQPDVELFYIREGDIIRASGEQGETGEEEFEEEGEGI